MIRVKSKKKNAKTIIHPIFDKCSTFTEDKYWISVYQKCARGTFPRYFYFKNKLLTYRKGNKIERILIGKSTADAFSKTMDFFQNIDGILSESNRKKRQLKEEEKMLIACDLDNLSWKDIKMDKVKDVLITEFINDTVEIMQYNQYEKDKLTSTIKKGFMLKYFGKEIYIENGRIVEIEGLVYDKKNKEYYIDPDYINVRPGRKINGLGIDENLNINNIDFMEKWVKYLKNLEIKQTKKNITYSSSWSNNSSDEISISASFSMPSLSITA